MLIQGYSPKKVQQMLPDEIKVSLQVIYRVDRAATYDDYCGVKPETEPEKPKVYMTKNQTDAITDAINRSNVLLESLFQIVKELVESLSA